MTSISDLRSALAQRSLVAVEQLNRAASDCARLVDCASAGDEQCYSSIREEVITKMLNAIDCLTGPIHPPGFARRVAWVLQDIAEIGIPSRRSWSVLRLAMLAAASMVDEHGTVKISWLADLDKGVSPDELYAWVDQELAFPGTWEPRKSFGGNWPSTDNEPETACLGPGAGGDGGQAAPRRSDGN